MQTNLEIYNTAILNGLICFLVAGVLYAVQWMRLSKPYTVTLPLDTKESALAVKYPSYDLDKSVLITGGCGFLGRHLVDALLLQEGVKICVFDIVEGTFEDKTGRVTVVKGDLTQGSSLGDAIKAHRVRTVFHVASPHPNGTNRKLFHAVNVTGTSNVIAACLEGGVPTLVFTSSASVVWQGAAQEGLDESFPHPTSFRDYYAETKAEAERMVMQAGVAHKGKLTTISLRPHAIWGPRDPQFLPTTIEVAKAGRARSIVGDGSNVCDFTYVGNVVHAHLLAAQAGHRKGPGGCAASGHTYFVTNGEPMPFWQFLSATLLVLGYDTPTLRLPLGLLVTVASVAQWAVGIINATRPKDKPIHMTLSPSRLQIAGTAHWYKIDAVRRDLGYQPLWTVAQGLYLTARAFPALRNPSPSALTLGKARRGNLVALGLIPDPDAAASARKGLAVVGANEAFRDEASLPEYTRAQVAEHNSASDAWVVIDGLVYDLTSFVDVHPGGDENLLQHVGADASVGFHGEQHPSHVFETVRKYLVGRLAEKGAAAKKGE